MCIDSQTVRRYDSHLLIVHGLSPCDSVLSNNTRPIMPGFPQHPASPSFFSEGLQFSCTGCHACCRHEEGYVFLSAEEMARICDYLRIPPSVFRKKYTREVSFSGIDRLSLSETPEHDCIFWSGGCTIYPVRPLQCSSYPFWPQNLGRREDWDEEARHCPGMNQGEHHSCGKISGILDRLAARRLLHR